MPAFPVTRFEGLRRLFQKNFPKIVHFRPRISISEIVRSPARRSWILRLPTVPCPARHRCQDQGRERGLAFESGFASSFAYYLVRVFRRAVAWVSAGNDPLPLAPTHPPPALP